MRTSVTFALAAVLSLGLAAGCSSDGDDAEEAGPTWPLTGEEGYPEGDTRQAITVKIENTDAGQPQIGIDSADVVVQELVEGGLTRLAVIFHSEYAEAAAAVRSMRETDIGLVLPTGGTLAASGGSGSTLAAIEAAGVPTAVEGDPGFSRDSSRTSPYNVALDVAELGGTLPDAPPPGPYLPFGAVPEDASGSPAVAAELRWPNASSSFTYDAADGRWTKTDVPDSSGFSFTNVIALSVPVSFSSGTDAAGTPIPTMDTTGSGSGFIATGGQVYEIGWSKQSDSAPWTFNYQPTGDDAESTSLGSFTVPAGRTWLALLPVDGGSASFTAPSSPASE